MNNCLVTKLKATVNNESLSKLNVLTIKTKASDSPTLDSQWIIIGASENGSVSVNSTSVGLYQRGISGALHPYPIDAPANQSIESHFENKDGIIEVTSKYNISKIIVGANGTVRMKEIYGIQGTINRFIIYNNVEEGEIDATKLKNALDIGGLTEIAIHSKVNIVNKLNKNTLHEFTALEKFTDGLCYLFKDGLGLDDLANMTSLKTIQSYVIKEGNLSSLAKLTNLESMITTDNHQHSGDIMDFINPWIQAGRTSGKIIMYWLNTQHNITLNGSPLSLPSGIVNGAYYLNWTSDGTVTITAR